MSGRERVPVHLRLRPSTIRTRGDVMNLVRRAELAASMLTRPEALVPDKRTLATLLVDLAGVARRLNDPHWLECDDHR